VRNWPTAERGPKLTSATAHPHATTTSGVRHLAPGNDISPVVISCRSGAADGSYTRLIEHLPDACLKASCDTTQTTFGDWNDLRNA
jgi:hypothetical protein